MKQFRVKKYKWARDKYVVEGHENGRRSRRFFDTKADADEYVSLKNIELKNHGREHAEFDSRLRVMAQECADKLKVFGKTLAHATDYFIAHLNAVERSCTVAQLVDEVIAKKTKECGKRQRPASEDYIVDLKVRLGRFKKTFGDRNVATITSLEIEDWLSGLKDKWTGGNLSPLSRGNYARIVNVAFTYAVKRGFALNNPIKEIDKPVAVAGDIGILTVAQTARLLESASPELLPCVAIGAFAGLRRAEIERLDWSDVHFDSNLIEVTAEKAKTARRRFVKMQPNMREWLLPLRKHSGNVTPDDFRKQMAGARAAAGITEWPNNALRHSFASYHLGHFNDAAALALEMGHTDSGMIFEHYRQLVKPQDAERYWNIKPAKASKKIVPIAAHGV